MINICTIWLILNNTGLSFLWFLILVVGGGLLLVDTYMIYTKGMGGAFVCKTALPYRIVRIVVYIGQFVVYVRALLWYIEWWNIYFTNGTVLQ